METTCRAWLAGVLTMLLLAVAGAVSAQTTIYPSTPLTSGQQVSGSVGYHSWKNYKITASSSHTQLQVDLTNLSADVDLYVRKDYSPTLTAYTCRPYKGGTTSESCTIALSGGATWYISAYGYQAGSFSIKATLSGVIALTSGQQVSGSVGLKSWKNYKIMASSSNTQLKVDMTNLSADVDLYVQKGSLPTLTSYACRPYKSGTTSESCTVSNSGSGVWYISAYGYQAGSFNLKATLSSGGAFVFPVTGIPGDSSYPSDTNETARQVGVPRTWYSVVWSGKYNGIWSTRGKGTGGHPGVDIRVVSGTIVRAIGTGTVYKSYDSATWGGLVVIKHVLQGSNEVVWSIYAHLKRRDVSAGTPITTVGQQIGLSGGGSTDPNHGTSTGPHLHFQIDKGTSFVSPYWPSSGNTEIPDPNLSNKTYDPLKFIQDRQ